MGPRPKIATTERREGVPVATGRPAFRSRGRRALARATLQKSAPVGAPPPRHFGGWMRTERTNPDAQTRRGNEEDCAVWHREMASTASS